ncbi:MAG: DUF4469 domain-containing protein [Treponema sp.]
MALGSGFIKQIRFFKGGQAERKIKFSILLSFFCRPKILARVPKNLPEGKVTVKVRTKYSGSGASLKEMRDLVFQYPCTATSQ